MHEAKIKKNQKQKLDSRYIQCLFFFNIFKDMKHIKKSVVKCGIVWSF